MDRRVFLGGALVTVGSLWLPRFPALADDTTNKAAASLPESTRKALETSPYVYVSPLLADGSESTCHGEVWYAWLDGDVVTSTAAGRWKARSIGRGLDRARLWVGDYGRWKKLTGRNEAFRAGPSFVAQAKIVIHEPLGLLDRLLEVYEKKYPKEITEWRERMRREVASGERVLLRYSPRMS